MFADVPLIPETASTHAADVDGLFYFLVSVCGFFAVLIAVLLSSFAIRYRRRSDSYLPAEGHSSLKLELTWSIIPLVFMMAFFFWGAKLYFNWARAARRCDGSEHRCPTMDVENAAPGRPA